MLMLCYLCRVVNNHAKELERTKFYVRVYLHESKGNIERVKELVEQGG